MTSPPSPRARRPTLPCLTIARSPANDMRVIVDAFVSTPTLVRLLTDRDGFVGDHRAELRELLQQLTSRLGAWIESAERSSAGGTRATGVVHGAPTPPPVTPLVDADAPWPADGVSARPAARHRHAVRRAASPPPAPRADWRPGPLLR